LERIGGVMGTLKKEERIEARDKRRVSRIDREGLKTGLLVGDPPGRGKETRRSCERVITENIENQVC